MSTEEEKKLRYQLNKLSADLYEICSTLDEAVTTKYDDQINDLMNSLNILSATLDRTKSLIRNID